jgi:phosphoglycolate phosphatase
MTRPLRLAIFDLDGTLVDSKHNIVAAVGEVARILNLAPPAPDVVPKVIGLSLLDALTALFPDVDPAMHQSLDREYRAAFVRMRQRPDHSEPLFPGTHEVLDQLEEAGFLLGIATGKATRGVDYVLNRHGLTQRFATVQTPDKAPGKPHPGMVLQALAETGVEGRNAVVIGDTTFDIHMALAAGAGAVGVTWGNHSVTELKAAGAHRLIDRLDELLHAAEALTAPGPMLQEASR